MNTSGKLNRSHSESELYRLNFENLCVQDFRHLCGPFERNVPVVKKTVVIVQEVYQNSPLILRSGQSIPNQLHKTENIHSDSIINSFVNTNISNTILREDSSCKINSGYDRHDGFTPMDIDLICNNAKPEKCLDVAETMDVDTDNFNYKTERLNSLNTLLKQRKFNKETDILSAESLVNESQMRPVLRERKKRLPCNAVVLTVMLISTLTSLYLWFSQDGIIFVNSDIQLQNLKKDLLENVYEQKGPVNIIIRSIQYREHWSSKIKILGFIGTSGVGKTFVANVLKKHFHQLLVHELYGLQLNFKNQWENILYHLKRCCLNLIIVDDLNKKDITDFFALVDSLPRNHYILLVSIFNIQYSDSNLNYGINFDDINNIRREFEHSGIFYELAVFHQFNMYQTKDWLEKQLKVQNVKYSEKMLNNVLYNHNPSYEGLKGLYSKLLLELENKG